MKYFLLWVFLLFSVLLSAQPEGKLFIHSGFISNQELGYIQYPQNQYHVVDTTDLDDMIIIGNKIYITNDKIYIYDINTLSKSDSIHTSSAILLGYDVNKLIVSKAEPPYLEVYDLASKSLIFSLDTAKIKSQAMDMLVDMGKIYLLYDTTITVIDLNLQDTIANITAKYNAWLPSYNRYLVNNGNKIYIEEEMATGAPRFAILSLDKSTLQIQNLWYQEFVEASYEPVLVENKLFLSVFPSYYDISADTFKFYQGNEAAYPLCYDQISKSVFLYKPLSFQINYINNNILSSGIGIPTYLNKSLYFNEKPEQISASKVIDNNIKIYPNPANNELNIMLPNQKWVKAIRIISLSGDNYVQIINNSLFQYRIDIGDLADGMYFIEIQFEDQVFKTKFIKTKSFR